LPPNRAAMLAPHRRFLVEKDCHGLKSASIVADDDESELIRIE
jgi:hypothetical protein